MSMMQEFKEFAIKGNVVDLAVGVIMGAAFTPIVTTLVDNMIMPSILWLVPVRVKAARNITTARLPDLPLDDVSSHCWPRRHKPWMVG